MVCARNGVREEAKTHAARAAESREKAEEPHEHHDVIEGLRERAEPLYESLDDAQKRRFEPLLRKHMGLPDRRR
jgi:hypothetical protein